MEDLQKKFCSSLSGPEDCIEKGLSWLVAYTDPVTTWNNEPTFLLIQLSVIFGVLLNYIHAWRNGGRFLHFWWANIIVSLVTECVCYLMPSIDNFWHAQGVISLFGRRFPLYIVLVYNQFWYTAWVTVLRLRLKWWAEPFAVGLCVILIDLPYDIMGVKMLWWTWHDTDNNIYDRSYHVPWTSYYFHSAFVSAMLFVFFGLRKLLMPSKTKLEYGNCILEWICTISAGVLAMPLGSGLFIVLLYHPLHDWFNIHSEVPVLMWIAALCAIVWISDRNPTTDSRTSFNLGRLFSIPMLNILQHFTLFAGLMFVAEPEEVKSIGLHQEIGPCNVTEETFSITGAPLHRRKYLCPTDYNEPFDFHCTPEGKPPADGSHWYTLCGLPYPNPMEYKLIVWFCCALGLSVFTNILLFSGDQQTAPAVINKQSSAPKSTSAKKSDKKKKKQHKD